MMVMMMSDAQEGTKHDRDRRERWRCSFQKLHPRPLRCLGADVAGDDDDPRGMNDLFLLLDWQLFSAPRAYPFCPCSHPLRNC